MGDLTQLLGGVARPQLQRVEISAIVSLNKPAPAAFTDPLYVVLPNWSTTYAYEISDWPACHGSTLPQPGAAVLLIRDDANNLRVVWWDNLGAATGFDPSGAAGGDLSGSFPNPEVATVLNGKTPVTTATALGGGLSGTLPNPSVVPLYSAQAQLGSPITLSSTTPASAISITPGVAGTFIVYMSCDFVASVTGWQYATGFMCKNGTFVTGSATALLGDTGAANQLVVVTAVNRITLGATDSVALFVDKTAASGTVVADHQHTNMVVQQVA